MFLGQETPSPSCTLYLFARSPIFIRLYLRLKSVPLHFLLRSSSFVSSPSVVLLLLLVVFYAASRVPSGYRCDDNNMQTFWYLQFECRKTGTGNHREEASGSPRRHHPAPLFRACYSISPLREISSALRPARTSFNQTDECAAFSFSILFLLFIQKVVRVEAVFRNNFSTRRIRHVPLLKDPSFDTGNTRREGLKSLYNRVIIQRRGQMRALKIRSRLTSKSMIITSIQGFSRRPEKWRHLPWWESFGARARRKGAKRAKIDCLNVGFSAREKIASRCASRRTILYRLYNYRISVVALLTIVERATNETRFWTMKITGNSSMRRRCGRLSTCLLVRPTTVRGVRYLGSRTSQANISFSASCVRYVAI